MPSVGRLGILSRTNYRRTRGMFFYGRTLWTLTLTR